MNSTKILVGALAASVVNIASASSDVAERQAQAVAMTKLIDGISTIIAKPECTIKTVLGSNILK